MASELECVTGKAAGVSIHHSPSTSMTPSLFPLAIMPQTTLQRPWKRDTNLLVEGVWFQCQTDIGEDSHSLPCLETSDPGLECWWDGNPNPHTCSMSRDGQELRIGGQGWELITGEVGTHGPRPPGKVNVT